nr:hypothetical protein CFP56_20309 [Quercus suber]
MWCCSSSSTSDSCVSCSCSSANGNTASDMTYEGARAGLESIHRPYLASPYLNLADETSWWMCTVVRRRVVGLTRLGLSSSSDSGANRTLLCTHLWQRTARDWQHKLLSSGQCLPLASCLWFACSCARVSTGSGACDVPVPMPAPASAVYLMPVPAAVPVSTVSLMPVLGLVPVLVPAAVASLCYLPYAGADAGTSTSTSN